MTTVESANKEHAGYILSRVVKYQEKERPDHSQRPKNQVLLSAAQWTLGNVTCLSSVYLGGSPVRQKHSCSCQKEVPGANPHFVPRMLSV